MNTYASYLEKSHSVLNQRDWWNVRTEPVGPDNPPSWEAHLYRPDNRSYMSVMEVGKGTGHEYPHFFAVLTPERAFLHSLVSELICRVSMHDKEALASNVDRLYRTNKSEALAKFKSKLTDLGKTDTVYRDIARAYIKHRQSNGEIGFVIDRQKFRQRGATPDERRRMDMLALTPEKTKEDSAPQKKPAVKMGEDDYEYHITFALKERLDQIYASIEATINRTDRDYQPGKYDKRHLTDFEKIFVAAFSDDIARRLIDGQMNELARDIVDRELDSGRLRSLPYSTAPKQCRHTVITGVMAAGKSALLDELMHSPDPQKRIDRSRSVMIDIDEFRDLEHIIEADNKSADGQKKAWANQTHEECHMIRRKILDRLKELGEKNNYYPNVVLMTSFLSERVRRWLTDGNPITKVYAVYCDPSRALHNAHQRAQKDHRWISTQRIVESVRDLATTVRYLFAVETGDNNLDLEIIDTTKANFEMGPDRKLQFTDKETVLRANSTEHVRIYNLDRVVDIHRAFYINPHAHSPHDSQLYGIKPLFETRTAIPIMEMPGSRSSLREQLGSIMADEPRDFHDDRTQRKVPVLSSADLQNSIRTSLRPHRIFIMGKERDKSGKERIIGIKEKKTLELKPGPDLTTSLGSVMDMDAAMKIIFENPTLPGRMTS
jgi:hypothetical protein